MIKDFKAGKYNIMVATSIGEEGLDIGSVDKIICYDASKSSVRMVRPGLPPSPPCARVPDTCWQRPTPAQLQRVGRTGRKREGIIYVLMGEGREEDSWNKAKDNYTSGAFPACPTHARPSQRADTDIRSVPSAG